MRPTTFAASLACLFAATGCASLVMPRGTFTATDFNAQPAGRVVLEFPGDVAGIAGGRQGNGSRVQLAYHRQDLSVAERGSIIARPPSRAQRNYDGIELDAKDLWMTQRRGPSAGAWRLTFAVGDVRVTRFPEPADAGDMTPVDSVMVTAPGLKLRVTRAASVIIAHDTVRVVVVR